MPQDQTTNTSSIRLRYSSGLLRAFMRFPILLYRLHLGWVLGRRFLLLEHRGRKSGMVRKAVVEVVDHDIGKGSYVVAAAWGNKSDWYNNIATEPNVQIGVGTKRFPALAKILTAEQAAEHLNSYAGRHPFAFRQLGSLLIGSKSHATVEIIKSFIEVIPFVEFIPVGKKAA